METFAPDEWSNWRKTTQEVFQDTADPLPTSLRLPDSTVGVPSTDLTSSVITYGSQFMHKGTSNELIYDLGCPTGSRHPVLATQYSTVYTDCNALVS
jgi:hypothetical protein